MIVTPVRCLKDNYAYLVTCERTGETAIVDPSEAEPVVTACAEAARSASGPARAVTTIWNTHHHADHVGGNQDVVARLGTVREVVGHVSDRGRIPGQTKLVEEGDELTLGALRVRILHIPGHTTGAVAYVVTGEAPEAAAVFTGDTLFLGGCGRLFEGTPAMMHASLSKLAALPKDARVYCGHEYTASNLRFAAHVEPKNAEVKARAAALADVSVPGTIAEELATNPFLRVRSPEIRATLGIAADASDADALGAIRAAKDAFR